MRDKLDVRRFDDERFYCLNCERNEKYGQLGKVKEMISKAPYQVYDVKTGKEVLPE